MRSLFAAVRDCLVSRSGDNSSGGITAEYRFPEGFIGFAGHFPGNPVLPGIAQILAVLHAISNGRQRLHAIKSCKFLRPVLPEETLLIRLTPAGQADGLGVHASLSVSGEQCAVMRLFLSPTPSEDN